jgi:nicotinate-nucleotide adenylyltransferase
MDNKKIGILGGTFNPIHKGHIKAAEKVIKEFFLDKILFIPSYIPPHKKNSHIAPPQHRFNMVRTAIDEYSDFIPSRIEIDAKEKSYSIITLDKIKKSNPEAQIFFILGIDAFLEIETWKDTKDLLEKYSFIVISRPGFDLKNAKNILGGRYKNKMIEVKTPIKKEDMKCYNIFLFHMDSLDIASSDIRNRIKRGKSIHGMVPRNVERYIKENKLYS